MNVTFLLTSTILVNDRYKEAFFGPYDRLEQTIDSVRTIKRKFPNSHIILADNSDHSLLDLDEKLVTLVDTFIDLSSFKELQSKHDNIEFKALGETIILSEGLKFIKQQKHDSNDIIVKLSGRYKINDDFNLNHHIEPHKYVFKNDIWYTKYYECSYIITTCYSLKYSLLDNYLYFLHNIDRYGIERGMEHAHFNFYDKNKDLFYLIDKLGVEGISYTGIDCSF